VPVGVPSFQTMRAIDFVIGIGWVVFWLGWMAAASRAKSGRTRWGYSVGVRLVMVVLILLLERVRAFRRPAPHDPALAGIGLGLFLVGLAVAIWARVHLGRNWGMPMSEKADPELVTSGPYRWIRNPIYSGLILAMIGTAIAVSVEWLVVVLVLGGYFVYSAVMEQRLMAQQFPDTYPAYRSSTKMLIPFVF
jgi:protein-S-isoprenylcysteine O-methyltransferase Ste14